MSYEELVKVLLDEYDNDARQLAAKSELERLTFDHDGGRLKNSRS